MTERSSHGDRLASVGAAVGEVLTGRRITAVVVTLALVTLSPSASRAVPGQEDPSGPASPADAGPTVEIDVDVALADVQDVNETVDQLVENVNTQVENLRNAENAVADAESALSEAEAAVSATEERIEGLTALSDEIVIGTFVNPPAGAGLEAFASDSMVDVALKQSLLSLRASDDAAILEELETARSDLEVQRDNQVELANDAAAARDAAAAELADLEAAVSQQADFFIAVEDRLEHAASEAVMLEGLDPAMAAGLEADRQALAGKLQEIIDAQEMQAALEALAEAQARAEAERRRQEAEAEAERQRQLELEQQLQEQQQQEAPGDIGTPSGSLATVSCPGGGSITVDGSLESNLSSLLEAAAADGVMLCGGGYRDPAEQVALRQQNCGTSDYAVYEMPASQCSPPTARPGTSEHEKGLAIDFTCNGGGTVSSGDSCFSWLSANANRYGLYNYPVEPWHWSTTGS